MSAPSMPAVKNGRVGNVKSFGRRDLARRAGEQAVAANAVELTRQDVRQEAADELVGAERHDALPARTSRR